MKPIDLQTPGGPKTALDALSRPAIDGPCTFDLRRFCVVHICCSITVTGVFGLGRRWKRPHTLFDRVDASTQYFCPQNPFDTYITYLVLIFSAYSLT